MTSYDGVVCGVWSYTILIVPMVDDRGTDDETAVH